MFTEELRLSKTTLLFMLLPSSPTRPLCPSPQLLPISSCEQPPRRAVQPPVGVVVYKRTAQLRHGEGGESGAQHCTVLQLNLYFSSSV